MTPCPCVSGDDYADCCGPLHRGERSAPTAVQLMRSRYAAFALGDASNLLRTWHPTTRPATLELENLHWRHLEIRATTAGGPFDTEGTVEFVAHYQLGGAQGSQHEVSRFVRDDGEWFYLDAQA